MIMNKKASMMKYVVGVIVMVIVLIVLLPHLSKIYAASNQAALDAACKESLDTAQKIKIFGGKLSDKMGEEKEIKCYTEYIKTRNEGEELVREFADHLYACFKLYGKRSELFDQDTGTYCIICKSLEIERAAELNGLVDFIMTKSAPSIEGGVTYYIDAFGGPPAVSFLVLHAPSLI